MNEKCLGEKKLKVKKTMRMYENVKQWQVWEVQPNFFKAALKEPDVKKICLRVSFLFEWVLFALAFWWKIYE